MIKTRFRAGPISIDAETDEQDRLVALRPFGFSGSGHTFTLTYAAATIVFPRDCNDGDWFTFPVPLPISGDSSDVGYVPWAAAFA